MSGPLEGLRVVDFSGGSAGPRATGILADCGADVIWVEPVGGDPFRGELLIPYSVFNRGKRSIVLDVEGEGRGAALELLGRADVLVESWQPGTAESFGMGVGQLHEQFPELVHCSITGFGVDGPYRDVPPYEALVHALIGTMGEQFGFREGPIFEALPFASIGAAYLAVIGILAALYRRNQDGAGRHVETSLYDGALAYLSLVWGDTDADVIVPGNGDRVETARGFNPVGESTRLICGSFRCSDDEYIGVHTGAVGAFGRLMKVLGLDDRISSSEKGLDMGIPLSSYERELLHGEIHKIFEKDPRPIWIERLLEADICGIPVLRPGEVFDAPQPQFNGMVRSVEDPILGRLEQVAAPIRFSLTTSNNPSGAPTPGQHDHEMHHLWADRSAWFTIPQKVDVGPLLDGIKILDLGAYFAGPFASRLLAGLGADVIKVETVGGDPLRGLDGMFRAAQARKRSIAIDLKDPEIRPALHALMRWADIVHHNMRPGAAERIGIGYADARAANPNVIYGYAPGWGSMGPYSQRQSFEPMMSGYVGVGFEVAGQYNPPVYPAANADPGNGLVGAVAMLMALLHRQRTGRGQYFENPQLNATMLHVSHIVRSPAGDVLGAMQLDPLQFGFGPLERLYETADGWICIVAKTEKETRALGETLGIAIFSGEHHPAHDDAKDHQLAMAISDVVRTRATTEWLSAFEQAGVPCARPVPYNNHAFMKDPENRRSGRVVEHHGKGVGNIREIDQLVRISAAEMVRHRVAPDHGQHTDEILSELGYGFDAIAALHAKRAAFSSVASQT